jgi:hypothetical protein
MRNRHGSYTRCRLQVPQLQTWSVFSRHLQAFESLPVRSNDPALRLSEHTCPIQPVGHLAAIAKLTLQRDSVRLLAVYRVHTQFSPAPATEHYG